jgi:hypothetical protein
MKKCRVCGEQPLDKLWWETSGGKLSDGLCSLCAEERNMKDRYEPENYTKTELEACEKCGEVSAVVKLTAMGWLCDGCHR